MGENIFLYGTSGATFPTVAYAKWRVKRKGFHIVFQRKTHHLPVRAYITCVANITCRRQTSLKKAPEKGAFFYPLSIFLVVVFSNSISRS